MTSGRAQCTIYPPHLLCTFSEVFYLHFTMSKVWNIIKKVGAWLIKIIVFWLRNNK